MASEAESTQSRTFAVAVFCQHARWRVHKQMGDFLELHKALERWVAAAGAGAGGRAALTWLARRSFDDVPARPRRHMFAPKDPAALQDRAEKMSASRAS